jgi:hypothetical protein
MHSRQEDFRTDQRWWRSCGIDCMFDEAPGSIMITNCRMGQGKTLVCSQACIPGFPIDSSVMHATILWSGDLPRQYHPHSRLSRPPLWVDHPGLCRSRTSHLPFFPTMLVIRDWTQSISTRGYNTCSTQSLQNLKQKDWNFPASLIQKFIVLLLAIVEPL